MKPFSSGIAPVRRLMNKDTDDTKEENVTSHGLRTTNH